MKGERTLNKMEGKAIRRGTSAAVVKKGSTGKRHSFSCVVAQDFHWMTQFSGLLKNMILCFPEKNPGNFGNTCATGNFCSESLTSFWRKIK